MRLSSCDVPPHPRGADSCDAPVRPSFSGLSLLPRNLPACRPSMSKSASWRRPRRWAWSSTAGPRRSFGPGRPAFAAKLRELLGPHQPPAEWKTDLERSVDLEDHRREELILTAEGHPPLPVYLLLPRGKADGPRAGVLALHGHGPYGYDTVAGREDRPGVAEAIQQSNYDYGRQLVRRGYVVAVPCLTPFGRRLGDPAAYGTAGPLRASPSSGMQLLGKLLMAENLRDCLWALELLARHAQVDAKRLGCVGLSYGGRMTMLTAALEPRIRVAVVSGALNVMQERVGSALQLRRPGDPRPAPVRRRARDRFADRPAALPLGGRLPRRADLAQVGRDRPRPHAAAPTGPPEPRTTSRSIGSTAATSGADGWPTPSWRTS